MTDPILVVTMLAIQYIYHTIHVEKDTYIYLLQLIAIVGLL